MRQRDPLSPLLFNIALEPLAIGIRSHPDIYGVKFDNVESLVNLYVDDLLVCLSGPEVSVPNLLNYFKTFSKLSGYVVNWEKSKFMPLVDNLSTAFLKSLPFKLTTTHFTYLGLKIPRSPKHLFKLKFMDMVNKLRDSIRNWKLLPFQSLAISTL